MKFQEDPTRCAGAAGEHTARLSIDNEYTRRLLDADNGLMHALSSLRSGNPKPYEEYLQVINACASHEEISERIKFWTRTVIKEARVDDIVETAAPPLVSIQGAGEASMNVNHSLLNTGDLFMLDGNHRAAASLLKGESPIFSVSGTAIANLPEWQAVMNGKTDASYRIKHQPHPHPLLWDLKPFRTMESCQARYGAVARSGIRQTYEIGCAEGVGLWLLRQAGVDSQASEIHAPSRTLAASLINDRVDQGATPESVPNAECLIIFSVLYHLLATNGDQQKAWEERIKKFPCVAIEISTPHENNTTARYSHMKSINPLDWWEHGKLIYVDHKQAGRETWLCWN